MTKPDILERLKAALLLRPGTADCDANALESPARLTVQDVADAVAEIERLRALAGSASDGQSFTDIKQEIKRGG